MASPAALSPVTEVVEFFACAPSREAIAAFRLSPAAQERIRALLARNAAGALSTEEHQTQGSYGPSSHGVRIAPKWLVTQAGRSCTCAVIRPMSIASTSRGPWSDELSMIVA